MKDKLIKIVVLIAILILGSVIIYNVFLPKTPAKKEEEKTIPVRYSGYDIEMPEKMSYTIYEDGIFIITENYYFRMGFDYTNSYDSYKEKGLTEEKTTTRTYITKKIESDNKTAKQFVTEYKDKNLLVGIIMRKDYKEIDSKSLEEVDKVLKNVKKIYDVDKSSTIDNMGVNGIREYQIKDVDYPFNKDK